jgi:hypothetical protein
MSPFHQLGTVTWTDGGQCNELSSLGCTTSPSQINWAGNGGIGWLLGAP